MRPAGLAAFESRSDDRSAIYSYENRHLAGFEPTRRRASGRRGGLVVVRGRPASYRTMAVWWVVSAKRPETRERRLATLIEDCRRPERRLGRRQDAPDGSPSLKGRPEPVVSCGSPTGGQSLVGHRAEIAQLVEHATENRGVASSILALGTTLTGGRDHRAEVAQLVEHHLAKVRVAGSSPVFRSISCPGRPELSRPPLPLRLVVGQRTLDP